MLSVNRRTKQEQRPSSLGLCLARRRKTKSNLCEKKRSKNFRVFRPFRNQKKSTPQTRGAFLFAALSGHVLPGSPGTDARSKSRGQARLDYALQEGGRRSQIRSLRPPSLTREGAGGESRAGESYPPFGDPSVILR